MYIMGSYGRGVKALDTESSRRPIASSKSLCSTNFFFFSLYGVLFFVCGFHKFLLFQTKIFSLSNDKRVTAKKNPLHPLDSIAVNFRFCYSIRFNTIITNPRIDLLSQHQIHIQSPHHVGKCDRTRNELIFNICNGKLWNRWFRFGLHHHTSGGGTNLYLYVLSFFLTLNIICFVQICCCK